MAVSSRATTSYSPSTARIVVAASVGNAVEWYDWMVYATFAVYFAEQFFPSTNPTVSLVGATSAYALAFFFRPLGGIVLGRIADLRGRRSAMIATVLLMSGGSLAIAVLPTYAQIGWCAPLLLVALRIAQAISVGGEVSNASAYLAEIAPPGRRGRYASVFYLTSGVCLLLSSGTGLLLSSVLDRAELESFGWRLAFGLGGLLGLFGLWLRRALVETDAFTLSRERARAIRAPLRVLVREHPASVVRLVGLTMLSTLAYYTFFTALTPYAVGFHQADGTDVFLALTLATLLFTALQYPAGVLSDRYGRRPSMIVWAAGFALLTIPLSLLVTDRPSLPRLLVVFGVGLALYSVFSAIAPAVMSELFPTELRALGIGAWYNATVAVFGGTAPLLVTALSAAGHPEWFFVYVSVVAVVALVVVLGLPETHRSPLP